MGESDAIVEFEAVGGLIVELKDAFTQVRPKHEALSRQLHDTRALILRIGPAGKKT
ncbi:hypothetical protein IVB22_21025 [Bradyrhizobium sp. 190]|uniref:hypothetical protein n=1 Tax=Bradyrhizobium sp. 190 TaxID=2782658 RepID=UPI001FF95F76|nr:hypothetical protein [Bradyrhizobium sp. 190]MCK1515006.1 hypothetical protein [Bradyrhizobium sp. 190]